MVFFSAWLYTMFIKLSVGVSDLDRLTFFLDWFSFLVRGVRTKDTNGQNAVATEIFFFTIFVGHIGVNIYIYTQGSSRFF